MVPRTIGCWLKNKAIAKWQSAFHAAAPARKAYKHLLHIDSPLKVKTIINYHNIKCGKKKGKNFYEIAAFVVLPYHNFITIFKQACKVPII